MQKSCPNVRPDPIVHDPIVRDPIVHVLAALGLGLFTFFLISRLSLDLT
jgi:hypothetical protein